MTTVYIPIPEAMNIGCTTCGNQAEVAIAIETEKQTEVIATACPEHNLNLCGACGYEVCRCWDIP